MVSIEAGATLKLLGVPSVSGGILVGMLAGRGLDLRLPHLADLPRG